MRWTLTKILQHFHYWTLDQQGLPAELRYNSAAHSLRLNAGDKRVFFLEKKGFLQNRFYLRTEYSIVIGESMVSKDSLSGFLILNDQKALFSSDGNQIVLYKRQGDPITSLEIDQLANMDSFEKQALLFSSFKAHLYWQHISAPAVHTVQIDRLH